MGQMFWGGRNCLEVEKLFRLGDDIPREGDYVVHPDNPEIIGVVERVILQRRENNRVRLVYVISAN